MTPFRKKARLAEGWLRGRPVWCSWQLVRRCDLHCQFCEHRADAPDAELDETGWRRVVSGLSGFGAMVVSLAGAEPFLHPDLVRIVGALAEDHFPVVVTNGWQATADRAAALWRAGLTSARVRLYAAEPARHDAACGLPGAHGRALAAVDAFVATRPDRARSVCIDARVGAEATEADLEGLARLAAAHGASLDLDPVAPAAGGLRSGVTEGQLAGLKRRHPHLRSSRFFLERLPVSWDGGVAGCLAGRAFLNVDHRGRVTQCMEFQRPGDVVGDLRAEEAPSIRPRLLRVHEENACRSCWYAARGEVEGLHTARGLLDAARTRLFS